MFFSKSREAKRTCSIVKKNYFEAKQHVYIEEFKYRSEANMFVSSNRSEANMFIYKNLNIEEKRRKLTLTCESSEAKRRQLFLKIKLAKRSEQVR